MIQRHHTPAPARANTIQRVTQTQHAPRVIHARHGGAVARVAEEEDACDGRVDHIWRRRKGGVIGGGIGRIDELHSPVHDLRALAVPRENKPGGRTRGGGAGRHERHERGAEARAAGEKTRDGGWVGEALDREGCGGAGVDVVAEGGGEGGPGEEAYVALSGWC